MKKLIASFCLIASNVLGQFQFAGSSNFITASSTNTLTNKSGNISQWTNNSNYYNSVSQMTNAIGGTPLLSEVDGSITNEIQSLSVSGPSINLSLGGGSVLTPSTSYSGGTGITVTNTTITNSRPDQTVTINGTNGSTVTGTYPSFTLNSPAQYSVSASTGISITGSYPTQTVTNTAPNQTVTLSAGNGIVVSGTYPNFTIALAAPSLTNNPARSVTTSTSSTGWTVSAKPSWVSYFVNATSTNPLVAGNSTAIVFLEYSTNAGSSWTSFQESGATSSVGLSVTVQLTTGQTGFLGAYIPASALVRLRYTTAGTTVVTFIGGQEVTY